MDHLEHPTEEKWNDRRSWFEQNIESRESRGSYLVSDQACAMMADLQALYCAGCWASVIIVALAVVDSQLRETEMPGFKGNTKDLIDALGMNPDLHWLRKRRNSLVHLDEGSPALIVDQQWADREQLEVDARRAIQLCIEAFFSNPGT